jgi:hypothetical protein
MRVAGKLIGRIHQNVAGRIPPTRPPSLDWLGFLFRS